MKFLVDDVKGVFGFVQCVFRRFKGLRELRLGVRTERVKSLMGDSREVRGVEGCKWRVERVDDGGKGRGKIVWEWRWVEEGRKMGVLVENLGVGAST